MATIKQKRAVKKIVENRGNISKGMREAGYSKATAKNPKNLTESKSWEKLMGEYLPDEDLTKKHQELLNATRLEHMVFPINTKDKNCDCPYIMEDDQGDELLFRVKSGSEKMFNTPLALDSHFLEINNFGH